jgi:hypothetical protein
MVIGSFAAMALLCLLVLLSYMIIPGREQGLMSSGNQLTKDTPGVLQETPASHTWTAEEASALDCGPRSRFRWRR